MTASTNAWSQMTAMATANAAAALGRLPAAISTGTASASQLGAVMQSVGGQVQNQFSVMGSSGQSFASRLGGAFSSISSGVSTVTGHIGSMVSSVGSGFVSMGRSVIGAVEGFGRFMFFARYSADAAMGFVQALLGQNAAMEQSRAAFIGLLGSGQAADAMLRRLQSFAATTPFEFPELVQDTQELIGMGFASRDVIPVLQAVGDAAAGVGRGKEAVDRVTLALGQMQARGKVTGQDMLQLTEAGIPAWRILAQSMGLTVAQVQKLSEEGKLGADSVTLLWQGMERTFSGQMARQAQTFNGLLSTLHDNAIMALMAFAGPIFNMAKSGLQQLTTQVGSPAFSNFARVLGQEVGGALSSVIAWIRQAVSWFGQFAPQVAQVGTAFNNLAVALAPTAARMQQAGTAGNLLAGALGALRLIIVGILGGITLLVSGIASVIQWFNAGSPAVQRLYTMFQQLGAVITGAFIPAWHSMQQSFADAMTALRPIMPQLLLFAQILGGVVVASIIIVIAVIGGLIVAFAGVLAGVVRIVSGIIQIISGFVQVCTGFVNLMADLFTGRFDRLGADLDQIMQGILAMFVGALNAIAGVFQVVWAVIIGFAQGFVSTLIALFTGLWQTLVGGSIIPDMCNGIVAAFTGMIASVLSLVSGFIAAAISLFVSLGANATMAVLNAANQIIGAFNNMRSQAIGTVQSLVSGVAGALGQLAGIAANAGAAMISALVGQINAGVGWVSSAINNVVAAIGNVLPHSPAKEGPLRYLNEFGPAITGGLAAGIIRGLPAVQTAVNMMVQPIPTVVTGRVNASAMSVITAQRAGGGSSSGVSDRQPIVIQFGPQEYRAFVENLGHDIGGKIILQRGGLR
jgi:tape measure domain-containing protein